MLYTKTRIPIKIIVLNIVQEYTFLQWYPSINNLVGKNGIKKLRKKFVSKKTTDTRHNTMAWTNAIAQSLIEYCITVLG